MNKKNHLFTGARWHCCRCCSLASVMLSGSLLQGLRVDLTENQLYTLSEGSAISWAGWRNR